MGITDIDDKIIARSNETKEDFRTLAKRYEAEFFQDLSNLNVLPPTMTVRVSDHIPEIISFVKGIMKTDRAYKAKSGKLMNSSSRRMTVGINYIQLDLEICSNYDSLIVYY